MRDTDLYEARLEAKRFLKRTESLARALMEGDTRDPLGPSSYWPHGGIALATRASLDLSESLAKLRKRER